METQFDVMVIGGGPAGVTAALRASELGMRVALVERAQLGGTCTNDGCVPTRVLAKAARLVRESKHFADYGLLGGATQVAWGTLLARAQQTVYRIHEKKQLAAHIANVGGRVFENVGDVRFVDAHTLAFANGDALRADKFIVCAGGHTRRLDIPGIEYCLTHRDIWSLKQLPASVIVIGGGGTGAQVASILDAFGVRVSLVSRGRIVETEDASVSKCVHEAFTRRGLNVITAMQAIERIEKRADGFTVEYRCESGIEAVHADVVMLAAGWEANVAAMNLDAAGVKTERGYIAVNDFQQTSAPHIFAAGDITGRMMLVQSAGYEGRLAAENAVLGVGQPYKHLIVPHGGFTDPEYAGVGLTEAQARAKHDVVVSMVPYSDLDRAVIDDHAYGFFKLIVSRETHRVLGAHVVGEQALEVIQLVAAAMAAETWVEQIAELELAYPTFTAIVGLAARQASAELGVVPLAPQWRGLSQLGARLAEWERSDQ
ncbi:MAG: NAD(P)/FAD-dependent oxidoreductase [Chloroflexi bacterium]|nr:NAD(P)/FAD-dependent oxidoreductase [Chloroflexota bacterium]